MRASLALAATWSVVAGCGRLHFDPVTDAALVAYSGHNRAFVTRATTTGALGGLAGADAFCQAAADAAGLDGTFGALLWDPPTLSASSRLVGERGWVDVTGAPIADLPSDFEKAATINPLERDEYGDIVRDYAWLGRIAMAPCSDWTTASTVFVTGSATWEAIWRFTPENLACDVALHVYCLETGRAMPVAPAVESGRLAFVSPSFIVGAGLSGADAQCNSDAAAAGLPGAYLAYIATSTGGPETRFTAGGAPWRRVDGVRIASSGDVLLAPDPTGVFLDSFVDLDATGGPSYGQSVWIGAPGANCSDWTDRSGGFVQAGAPSSTSLEELRDAESFPCGGGWGLLCLQL